MINGDYTRWSESAWVAAEDIYQAILRHPFICQLAAGTLPEEKYTHYLSQDRIYLGEYFRVLAHVASRIRPKEYADDFLRFATDGIAVERSLHSFYLSRIPEEETEISPACALYTATLKSMAYEQVEVEAAALLPCFWIYYKVGCHIHSSANDLDSNPYKEWISTYADDYFRRATERAIEICDNLAADSSEAVRKRMTEIFRYCARMEYLFWDSAWELEKWEI